MVKESVVAQNSKPQLLEFDLSQGPRRAWICTPKHAPRVRICMRLPKGKPPYNTDLKWNHMANLQKKVI